jgi:hypothetical protein
LMVRIGQGLMDLSAMQSALEGELVQELAPPQGLCLTEVLYSST